MATILPTRTRELVSDAGERGDVRLALSALRAAAPAGLCDPAGKPEVTGLRAEHDADAPRPLFQAWQPRPSIRTIVFEAGS